MRKSVLIFLTLALATTGFAQTGGWWSDYVVIDTTMQPRVIGTWYWIGDDPGWGTKFDGAHLGTFGSGGFYIGCDMRYWSTPPDRGGGALYYMIDNNPSTITELIWDQRYIGGNDYQGVYATSHNIGSGLSLGTHTLSVWAKSWGDSGDLWLSAGGANYNATFTIVPEPTTLVLVGAGIAGLLVYRRRR